MDKLEIFHANQTSRCLGLLSFGMSNCEVVIFPLVSWVRFGS